MEVFFDFFLFLLPFRNSIMPNNVFLKKFNNLSFSTKFYVFFLKIAMYQKIAKFSTLSTGVKLNHTWKFSSIFFSFYYRLGTVSCQITSFSKNSLIWVFQRYFIFFLKIAMYQKIAKFSTLSTGVKLNHKWKFSSIFPLSITI